MGNLVDGVGFPVEGRFAGETVGLPVELHDFTVKSTILIENHYIGPMGNQLQRSSKLVCQWNGRFTRGITALGKAIGFTGFQ